jgi:SAM-dependent methyltransferase
VLTVDFDRLRVGRRTRFIDVGAGAGRHSFEALRRGADVVAFDQDAAGLDEVAEWFAALAAAGEVPPGGEGRVQVGDALALPYPDGWFDSVLASEILEHVPQDERVIAELVRVLAPGGTLGVTVPRWLPERICWALSDSYHANEGGHIRIYRADELAAKVERAGVRLTHRHHAHALHSPYWWLKCAVGTNRESHPLVDVYHKLLVWDMMKAPALTRGLERALDPLIGKSVVLYFVKPLAPAEAP